MPSGNLVRMFLRTQGPDFGSWCLDHLGLFMQHPDQFRYRPRTLADYPTLGSRWRILHRDRFEKGGKGFWFFNRDRFLPCCHKFSQGGESWNCEILFAGKGSEQASFDGTLPAPTCTDP